MPSRLSAIVYNDTHQVTVLNRNSLYLPNRNPLSAVFVTPNDKPGTIKALLSAAASRMPNKQIVGYQPMNAKPLTSVWSSPVIDAGAWKSEAFFLTSGEKICVKIDQTSVPINVYGLTSLGCMAFSPSSTAVPFLKSAVGGSYGCYTANVDGTHCFVYYNPTIAPTGITRTRDASHYEIAYYHGEAIFDTLKAMGMKYVNTPGGTTWWNSIQNVNYPSETVANKAGNCLDGTLVFASAFEAMGMRPQIIYRPGHAYIAVANWSTGNLAVFIETTMVGTASYATAVSQAAADFQKYSASGQAEAVDVESARMNGINPAPM